MSDRTKQNELALRDLAKQLCQKNDEIQSCNDCAVGAFCTKHDEEYHTIIMKIIALGGYFLSLDK